VIGGSEVDWQLLTWWVVCLSVRWCYTISHWLNRLTFAVLSVSCIGAQARWSKIDRGMKLQSLPSLCVCAVWWNIWTCRADCKNTSQWLSLFKWNQREYRCKDTKLSLSQDQVAQMLSGNLTQFWDGPLKVVETEEDQRTHGRGQLRRSWETWNWAGAKQRARHEIGRSGEVSSAACAPAGVERQRRRILSNQISTHLSNTELSEDLSGAVAILP